MISSGRQAREADADERTPAWLKVPPVVSDIVVAAVTGLVAVLPATVGPQPMRFAYTAALFALLAAGCVALVFRRRYPWVVWGVTIVLGLMAMVISGGPTPMSVPAIVALYTVSSQTPMREAIAATLVSILIPTAFILLSPHQLVTAVAYGVVVWNVVALLAGTVVRTQRGIVEAANERARLAEATREEEAQLRVAEDRIRIARELHDVVAHHVSAINVQAGVAGVLIRSDPDAAAEALAHVRRASQEILREMPAMLGVLRTTEDRMAIEPSPRLADLERLISRSRATGLDVVLTITGTPQEFSSAAELTAYRVVQESLTNAGKHGIGTVEVGIDQNPEWLTVTVGNRLRPSATIDETHARYGLQGMHERVSAVGGQLSVGIEHGKWLVRARIPAQPGEGLRP
ncbi:MAG TPA: histidine kinase [Aldersonia sp.]